MGWFALASRLTTLRAKLTVTDDTVNVGTRLTAVAEQMPNELAVAMPLGRERDGTRKYKQVTFRELEDDSNLLADGLQSMGVTLGTRIVLMVRPSIDFISLVFALFKAGVVTVLIDPGMGRKNLIHCLEAVKPEGFVAIPSAQAVRCLLRRRFPDAKYNVTVGRRWFWRGPTINKLRQRKLSADFEPANTSADDPAAIIFTTGSTGPPKGVLYRHINFDRQVEEIRDRYGIQPGEIDLPCFPLFALFNSAMGVSTIVPDMDPTRPADVDPRNIIEAANDWNVTQAFGSPALWNAVGQYCERKQVRIPSLRRALSAGAPVPPHVIERVKAAIADDGDIHTPYGATEALPVATISGSEVLGETAEHSKTGAGTCVGRRFPGIEWKIIQITDEPIVSINQIEEVPNGEIGELMVAGDVVTREYFTRVDCNPLHKVKDGDRVWHRMGDVGYLDDQDRFWFCGRKAHRVLTIDGQLFTIPCEAIINNHPAVYRSALVGLGNSGNQEPIIVVELWPEKQPKDNEGRSHLLNELAELANSHKLTRSVQHFLIHPSLPVDIRHNSKIFREQLAPWAEQQLSGD